jgi:cation diffusion facilitator CzcD-associated flavoprotein CzcO
MNSPRQLKIAVVGAGASGIMALIKLREIGQPDVTIFEKTREMGGTWRDNRYPGITCDVPSHLYRYSFAPNPDWSRVCASGSEILAYLKGVYEAHGVEKHVVFGAEVIRAEFRGARWTLKTTIGAYGPFDAVITAMGILRFPIYPDIEGLGSFAGRTIHSARWDEAVVLQGRRVGIIGTGSTATQILPAIVDEVAKASMFQRTAQWIMPLQNNPIPEEEKECYRRDRRLLQEKYAHLAQEFNSKFAAAVVGENPAAYQRMVARCEENLRNSVVDPEFRVKLTPNYKVGCKRLIMSDTFYEAIQKPNANLVTDAIVRIEPSGVRTDDGRLHELDVLVLATGYDAHSTLAPMEVIGKEGLSIERAWTSESQAYLGVTVPGFPNFFMIGGPNSPIGNFSFLLTAEHQCGYAVNLIRVLASGAATEIVPKEEVVRSFNEAIRRQMPVTVWASGCQNWYMDRNGTIASWPWTWERFEDAMSALNLDDYDITRRADA